MNDLKPCPWCREMPVLVTLDDKDKKGNVLRTRYCYCCDNKGKNADYAETAWFDTEAEAAEAWNNRPGDDDPETAILLGHQAKVIKRQAGVIERMDAELAEARTRIKEHCKKCWVSRFNPAQCRTCALHPYKEPERWKTELVGNWDEVPADE